MAAPARQGIQALSVQSLKGVGPKVAEKLAKLGATDTYDLLFHLPKSYQDRTRITAIKHLRIGQSSLVQGEISGVRVQITPRGRRMMARLSDETGQITLRFFHFSNAQQTSLKSVEVIRAFGEVRIGPNGLEMVHPEYDLVREGEVLPLYDRLTSLYPTTEGLHQITLRKLIQQALAWMKTYQLTFELLPEEILTQFQFPTLVDALLLIHEPTPEVSLEALLTGQHPAQQRLAFEELLAHQLSLMQLKAKQEEEPAWPLLEGQTPREELLAALPFELTGAQQRVIAECDADLEKPAAMTRLLQGDVGSGKTLVAAMVALKAIASGYQVALMAPTEILAEQHYQNFKSWFDALKIPTALLVSKLKTSEKRACLEALAAGDIKMLVGTHALFQDQVSFHSLALVIVDEQHRFGVEQRLELLKKGEHQGRVPHQLIMTATPIPRTLAMVAYADLAQSIIDELPPGRTPVETVAVAEDKRDKVIERIAKAVAEGRQVYWVCTLIEESEALQCQAAEDTLLYLQNKLPDYKIGLVHGRNKPAEKEATMAAFQENRLQVLVATTVIEVGVDVPNASLMVIENPERLGLSQLHQLRGRVGRGTAKSYCVLMYKSPLSEHARKRLSIMRQTTNGFVIAEEDLALRGPGEVLGRKQTGMVNFRIADLYRDRELIPKVQEAAQDFITRCPEKVDALINRWLSKPEEFSKV